jgi:hypothetical protein
MGCDSLHWIGQGCIHFQRNEGASGHSRYKQTTPKQGMGSIVGCSSTPEPQAQPVKVGAACNKAEPGDKQTSAIKTKRRSPPNRRFLRDPITWYWDNPARANTPRQRRSKNYKDACSICGARRIVATHQLAGLLACNKYVFDPVVPKYEHFNKMFSLLGFGSEQKQISQWCLPGGQMTPTPPRSIVHAAKLSQMPYNANICCQAFQ